MSRIVHFEIHASDPQALIDFYSGLLGWTFRKWEGPADYWMITTGPADQMGIDGGMMRRQGAAAAAMQAVNAYVCTAGVESLDEKLAAGAKLGAVVALPKMAVPGVGWLAYIKDPDGNLLGLLQPDMQAV